MDIASGGLASEGSPGSTRFTVTDLILEYTVIAAIVKSIEYDIGRVVTDIGCCDIIAISTFSSEFTGANCCRSAVTDQTDLIFIFRTGIQASEIDRTWGLTSYE